MKALYLAAFAITALALVFRLSTPVSNYAAYVASLGFGAALLVSLSTVFIPRYAIPIDPLVLVVDVLAAWTVLSYSGRIIRWPAVVENA